MRGGSVSGATGSAANPPVEGRRRPLDRLIAILLVALWVLLPGPWPAMGQSPPGTGGPPAPTAQPPSRRVLLLYSEPRLTPAIVASDARIRATLESRSPAPVSFYTEYLDLNLFDGGVPQPELRELLRRKYATRPIDLIMPAGSRSLRVALHNREDLFSGAPVVFVSVDRRPQRISGLTPTSRAHGSAWAGWRLSSWRAASSRTRDGRW